MRTGELITVTIERLGSDCAGMASVEGRTVSVPGAAPGDVAQVRVLRVTPTSASVRLEAILTPGIPRIAPRCIHAASCGGCRWQDIPYDDQCRLKRDLVSDTLAGVSGLGSVEDIAMVPSPEVFGFRNKMEFTFDQPPGAPEFSLGLHEYGRYNRVFEVTDCLIQSPAANRILAAVREFSRTEGLSVYGLRSHQGLLRFCAIRAGRETGDLMVNLVTSDEPFGAADTFVEMLRAAEPGITTVIQTINRTSAGVATGDEERVLFGPGVLRDRIGNLIFTISPDAFFQTNTRQAANLYAAIAEFAALEGNERVLDLYCGTGTIGLSLAPKACEVTGIEITPSAVCDAERNARDNGIANCTFLTGKVEDLVAGREAPDLVICDPPRVGIHPRALEWLVRVRIPRLIYVSCNIHALPKDLERLVLAGYRIRQARVFDMSPHTRHIETLLLLEQER